MNMVHNIYNTKHWKKKVVLIALVVALIAFLAETLFIRVQAEEQTVKGWVLCQPADYVNARTSHSRKSPSTGRFETGDELELDGKTKDGFVHVVGPNLESGDYWVYVGYVSMDEPEWYGDDMEVIGTARVAARKNMTGDVRVWLQPGDIVMVYWITEEWAVTNRGFIRTEWLEVASV